MHQVFNLPPQQPLSAAGRVLPGSKASFFLTNSSTPTPVYTTSALDVTHTQPVEADGGGRFPTIYLDPSITYKVTITDSNDVLLYTIDPVNDQLLSAATIGEYLYPRTAAEISAGVTPVNYTYQTGDIRRYGGVGDGTTNNDDAFADADAASAGGTLVITIPSGDFLTTAIPAFSVGVRLVGEGRIVTATTHRRTWEYGGEASTASARTYYVNASAGNDANTGLSSGAAFKTLQRAWNQLPPLVLHRITINYANGNYEETELATGDMERPAILWLTGKMIRARSDQGGGGSTTTGYVLFVPASSAAVIRTIGDYKYGVYASQVNNVAFSGLNVTANVAASQAMVVTHRPGTYLHISNLIINGNSQASQGFVAEASAVAEINGASSISGCSTDLLLFDESWVQLSNETEIGSFSINGRGSLLCNGTVTVTGASAIQNGQLNTRGNDASNHCVFSGTITCINGEINATYATFSAAAGITGKNANVYLNACAYSGQIYMEGGNLRLEGGTQSWISPAVASAVADPVAIYSDCSFSKSANSEIVGSTGRTNATRGVIAVSVANNSDVIPVYLGGGAYALNRVSGSGGAKTNCTLAAVDSVYGDTPAEGQVLRLINYTANSVQIVNGSTANIVSNAIVLGANSTNYRGIELVWESSLWREVSRSLVVP
jgi:hypothetical protein